MSSSRRLPAPWTVQCTPGGYCVRDADGHVIAYTYGREHGWNDPRDLTVDEARRIAVNIAKLPALLTHRLPNTARTVAKQPPSVDT